MRELLLTLGHNSSAILVEDGQIVSGYENERLTGVKSDSQFPAAAIKQLGVSAYDKVYVTHWEPTGDVDRMKAKHWQAQHPAIARAAIYTHEDGLTHHDTHAHGVIWFAGPTFPQRDTYVVVCDGFGNFGEHLSIYRYEGFELKLLKRYFGYGTSLGLMYQYTTAFLELKMHEDEYKILGYEAHVHEVYPDLMPLLDVSDDLIATLLSQMHDGQVYSHTDPLLNIEALPMTQHGWIDYWLRVCRKLHLPEPNSFTTRAVISYIVQRTLEEVLLAVILPYKPRHLLCSGGVFYNVKLNYRLLSSISGRLCVYPLAGDQGNALGMYAAYHNNFQFPYTLCWGQRQLKAPEHNISGLACVRQSEVVERANRLLERFGFVNVVRGAMEFGPRALCNTTTFAIATKDNVDVINRANGRASIMPMAPVVPLRLANLMFHDLERVWHSAEYMVIALRYKDKWGRQFMGAAHRYQIDGEVFTGRPQTIDETHWAHELVARHGLLINTSFNVHGQPIVCTMNQIVRNHMFQRDHDEKFHTIVVTED